jgi:hypothetical protein
MQKKIKRLTSFVNPPDRLTFAPLLPKGVFDEKNPGN